VDTIVELLEGLCRAAIVTPSEHRELGKLPKDWDWRGVDPFIRYGRRKLIQPTGW